MDIARDINTISAFVSQQDIASLSFTESVDCIVLCVCAVLHSAETVFETLVDNPRLTKTVVLCGGIGHSTELIHNAVAKHPQFKKIAVEIASLAEAQILLAIWETFFANRIAESATPRILVEDRSTTCATNAIEARKLLEAHGIVSLDSVIIVQDPTMVRRTVTCFERVYSDHPSPPNFVGHPVFVPRVQPKKDEALAYDNPPVDQEYMWKVDRFLELIMGEIPRLRDDEHGYGPKGKDTIVHVDIPDDIEAAYERLVGKIRQRRYDTL